MRIWRTDGECVRVLRGHREWVYTLDFAPLGDKLCSGSFDGTLRVWDVINGVCLCVIKRPGVSFHSVRFRPGDGMLVAAASSEKVMRLFRVSDGEMAGAFAGHTGAVTCVSFQPGAGLSVVTGSIDCTLRVWCVSDGRCTSILGHRSTGKVMSLADLCDRGIEPRRPLR